MSESQKQPKICNYTRLPSSRFIPWFFNSTITITIAMLEKIKAKKKKNKNKNKTKTNNKFMKNPIYEKKRKIGKGRMYFTENL